MDLLFVCSTPPCRLLRLHHAVISLVGRWLSELRATLTIKVSCRVAIYFLVLGISNNLFLIVSFVTRYYLISAILMPSMRRMLRFSKTSSFKRRDVQSTQVSYPHRSKLMGMARKMRYLLIFLTLVSVHNLAGAPIDVFTADRRALMS